MSSTEHQASVIAKELLSNGFCRVTGAMPAEKVKAIDCDLAPAFENAPFCAGHFYGNRTRRFGRLLLRSAHAEAFVRHEAILQAAEHILAPACDTIQLNLTQGIAIHPGELTQMPHRDQDMWRLGPGAAECLVNVIWPFTPFTRENGATWIWPRSHGPAAREDPPDSEGLQIEMEPGDALVFLGSALHGAGANTSGDIRRGMIAGYSLGWLKPYENQWLAYPPAVARRFSPELAALVGYRQHRPNLGNHEGMCPSVLLGNGPAPGRGAADALLPAQASATAAYAARQRSG
ncbi:phytanoyl-CoA dioxygenase family protein [Novosphingobium sp. YAF33]|uniref:phytanoyl-CoA dioxygenase family protein n=1 Tax=Novosphingobium sp. YAF33 TaxID=3233082 RepID=UPI003F99E53E